MAYSYAETTAGGSSSLVNVPFPYLDQSHVHVYLNGAEVAANTLTWTSSSVIQLPVTPTAGQKIEVRRLTPIDNGDAPLVDYVNGSLSPDDMNRGQLECLYNDQELEDYSLAPIGGNGSNLDAQGRTIENLGATTLPNDAASKAYVDAIATLPASSPGGDIPHVRNNASLKALPSTYAALIIRDDFSIGLGAPRQVYRSSASAPTLKAGAGDDGYQVLAADGGSWIAVPDPAGMDIRQWGATGAGYPTDDHAAVDNALASGVPCPIIVPCLTFYYNASTGIVVPAGAYLKGVALFPTNPAGGSTFMVGLSVPTAMYVSGAADSVGMGNGSARVSDLRVTRAAGTVPAASQGIQFTGGYNSQGDNLMATRHYNGIYMKANGNSGIGGLVYGISAKLRNLFTGAITGNHFVYDGWAECYIAGGRFGMDGAGDVNSNSFVLITGGLTGLAGGPNGLHFDNFQFNQGAGTVTNWIQFSNVNGGGINAANYEFSNCSLDMSLGGTNFIRSDSGVSIIDQLQVNGCSLNAPNFNFFSIDAATQLSRVHIIDNLILNPGGTFDFPSTQHSDVQVCHNTILSEVTVIGATNSTLVMTDNAYFGDITVERTTTGVWAGLKVGGNLNASAVFTNSLGATPAGLVELDFAGIPEWTDYTPGFTLGSGALTTATSAGRYKADYNIKTTFISATLAFTTVGSASGSVAFGLPTSAKSPAVLVGRERSTGKAAHAFIAAGANIATMFLYDNTVPLTNGYALDFTGAYENE